MRSAALSRVFRGRWQSRRDKFAAAALNLNFTNGSPLDSRITFTRNSAATYFNSSGVLSSASANTPRFDYDPVTLAARGLLIEEQRTNLLFPADATTGWAASPTGCVSATANAATSPDGTANATKLVTADTLSNSHIWYKLFAGAINTSYVGSGFFKAAEYSRVSLYFGNTAFASTNYGALFDLSNGTVVATTGGSTATITAVGNGWYRCTVTGTSDADGGNYVISACPAPASVTAVNGGYIPVSTGLGIYAYGTQVEAGAFATSYIPTTTAQATRVADSAVMTGTNFSSWYNATEGTLYSELVARLGINQGAVVIRNAAGTNSFRIRKNSSNNYVAILRDGTTKDISVTPSPALTEGQTIRIATAVKTNDCAVTGGGQTPSAQATFTLNAMTALDVGGSTAAGESSLNGHIRRIAYYPRRLTNAELQGITT